MRHPGGTRTRERRETAIKDSNSYRRHRNGCRFYREDWSREDVLYISICLLDMPPETRDEEWKCMTSRRGCWRLREMERRRGTA